MAYTRINWQDGPSGGTPLSAANLNHMDQGIADAHADLDAMKGYVDNNFARIYPTIYSVDFDGTIEIEAGGVHTTGSSNRSQLKRRKIWGDSHFTSW